MLDQLRRARFIPTEGGRDRAEHALRLHLVARPIGLRRLLERMLHAAGDHLVAEQLDERRGRLPRGEQSVAEIRELALGVAVALRAREEVAQHVLDLRRLREPELDVVLGPLAATHRLRVVPRREQVLFERRRRARAHRVPLRLVEVRRERSLVRIPRRAFAKQADLAGGSAEHTRLLCGEHVIDVVVIVAAGVLDEAREPDRIDGAEGAGALHGGDVSEVGLGLHALARRLRLVDVLSSLGERLARPRRDRRLFRRGAPCLSMREDLAPRRHRHRRRPVFKAVLLVAEAHGEDDPEAVGQAAFARGNDRHLVERGLHHLPGVLGAGVVEAQHEPIGRGLHLDDDAQPIVPGGQRVQLAQPRARRELTERGDGGQARGVGRRGRGEARRLRARRKRHGGPARASLTVERLARLLLLPERLDPGLVACIAGDDLPGAGDALGRRGRAASLGAAPDDDPQNHRPGAAVLARELDIESALRGPLCSFGRATLRGRRREVRGGGHHRFARGGGRGRGRRGHRRAHRGRDDGLCIGARRRDRRSRAGLFDRRRGHAVEAAAVARVDDDAARAHQLLEREEQARSLGSILSRQIAEQHALGGRPDLQIGHQACGHRFAVGLRARAGRRGDTPLLAPIGRRRQPRGEVTEAGSGRLRRAGNEARGEIGEQGRTRSSGSTERGPSRSRRLAVLVGGRHGEGDLGRRKRLDRGGGGAASQSGRERAQTSLGRCRGRRRTVEQGTCELAEITHGYATFALFGAL